MVGVLGSRGCSWDWLVCNVLVSMNVLNWLFLLLVEL